MLDVTANGTANSTKVELWSANSPLTANQKWVVTSVGTSGYYKLQAANATGKVLHVAGNAVANGAQVDIYTDNGATGQQWKITDVGGGYYSLTPANATTSRLDIAGNSTTNGAKVEIWSANSPVSNNQKFQFVKQ